MDFQKLPGYQRKYVPRQRVFFIPLYAECKYPIPGIISAVGPLAGDYEIYVGPGKVLTSKPHLMRPLTNELLGAHMKGLQDQMEAEDAAERIAQYEDYAVSVFCTADGLEIPTL